MRKLLQKHDCSQSVFLAEGFGYLTGLARFGLSGQLKYADRNPIGTWFHTLKMRIDRFHSLWVGSRRSVRQWLAVFVHYYNFQRPDDVFLNVQNATPTEQYRKRLLRGYRIDYGTATDAPTPTSTCPSEPKPNMEY